MRAPIATVQRAENPVTPLTRGWSALRRIVTLSHLQSARERSATPREADDDGQSLYGADSPWL